MSLILTSNQNVRAAGRLDKFEMRPSRYGALDLFLMQSDDPTGIITEDMKTKGMSSMGNTFEVPVIDYDGDVTISNTRSVTISDSENTSNMVTITWNTFSFGFTIAPMALGNNEISIQQDYEAKLKKYILKLASTIDSACVTSLAAAKTQVFNDALNYSISGNSVQCPWSLRNNFIGDINVLMAANDFFDQIHIVGSNGIESIVRLLSEKGLYNAENKQLQYSDKILHFTNQITSESNVFATGYAVQSGSVGLLFRFEPDAINGTIARTGHEWGIDTLPMLNIPVGTYYYESVGDYSGIIGAASAHLTRTLKEHYGFSVDIAFLTAYNSDPTEVAAPIMKFEIASEAASDTMRVVVANTQADPVYTREVPTTTTVAPTTVAPTTTAAPTTTTAG